MSLLMDALKKAEQAKQGGQTESAAGTVDGLRLEPIDASAAAETPPQGRTLPELPAQLEVLDSEFITPGRPAAPAAAVPRPTARAPASPSPGTQRQPAATVSPAGAAPATSAAAERSAAQQLFAAKQPAAGRKGFMIAVSTLGVLGVAAIGGYFWWQLQPKSSLAGANLAQTSPRPAPAAPAPASPSAAPAPLAVAPAPTLPGAAAAGATNTAAAAADKREQDDDAEDKPAAPRQPAAATRERPTAPARAAVPTPAAADSPIRISRSQLQVNPSVARGFEALAAGDFAVARTEYERVLRTEPKNHDAMHGMANIALRQGDTAGAEHWYLKALEADPKDAAAQAGMIGLKGQGDPIAAESRLKTMITAQPEVAALHFALGNVYARQGRWNEAQQAYFKAFNAEPEQPDYIYNLAVSLDHLRQPRLATQYYQQALDAVAQRPAGFDKAQIATRLRELKP